MSPVQQNYGVGLRRIMLHFILGKAVSGKTEYLHKKLGEIVDSKKNKTFLIVPEQFTFETEKGILNSLGAIRSNKIEVLSFTRLAQYVFDEYGVRHKDIISDQGRLIYMSMALSSLCDKLEFYKKHIDDPSFVKSMLFVVDEFKQSSFDETVQGKLKNVKNETLKEKMRELILICNTYEAIISESYLDTGDILEKLSTVLKKERPFENATVALDGFTNFNAQTTAVIEQILMQADDVFVSLCADEINYSEDDNDVFAFTRRTASRLKNLAKKNEIAIAKPIILDEETVGYKRYTSLELYAIDENLYKPDFTPYSEKCSAVKIYCAADIEDECAYTSRKIRQLMRDGYRCREIAVIYRDAEKYEKQLRYAFKKYEIPTFEDTRQPILNQPLVLYIQNALKICADGFNTESVMRFLKTGISRLSVDEISELENYVYLWQIDGAKWKNDFMQSPFGFDDKSDEKKEQVLTRLNEMRKKAVEPILELKEKMSNKDGFEMTKAVYEFLIESNADKNLKQLAFELEKRGENALALEQKQIWDMLMQLLNETALALKDKYVSNKKYLEIFNMSVSSKTLGRIPNAVDEVIIGSADRIRARGIKAVFVLGANAEVFPASNSAGGILSDRDRNALLTAGIELFDINKFKTTEERFIAYNALCCAHDKLYITYSLTTNKGEKKSPSELVTMISDILPNVNCENYENIPFEEKIEGEKASFELMASLMRNNDYYGRNLLHYFDNIPKYSEQISAVKRVCGEATFSFSDKNTATELFGKDMYLSASKIDVYEKCPFQYFCKYGINAKPRERAILDPRQGGNIVHSVLETLMKKYKDIGVENVGDVQRNKDVLDTLRAYATENLGGLEDKDQRFVYQFNAIARTLDIILERIVAEFKNSSFKPCDFELSIGRSGESHIPAYIVEADDDGKVIITGSIDRVDKLELDGKTYIRVIDYKTGGKELVLSDILGGLNMQMLIYLFAVINNGKEYYSSDLVPAGVLYFPAKSVPFTTQRSDDGQTLKNSMYKESAMNGLILDDTRIIKAMDFSEKSIFIPAKVDPKTGKAKGTVIGLKQLSVLNERIDCIISDMAKALHNGAIPALPVYGKGHDTTCDFCDYKSVCSREKTGKYRHIRFDKHEECLNKLSGGEEDGEKLD